MMAVAANAHKRGGASICFVRVEPVSTYGIILDSSVHGSESPVVRIRPAPTKYVPPHPIGGTADETRALLLQAPAGDLDKLVAGERATSSKGALGPGEGADDVRLLIPLEGQESRTGPESVVVPVGNLEAIHTVGPGDEHSRGKRRRSDQEGSRCGLAEEDGIQRGRVSSEDDSRASRSSSHRTSSASGDGHSPGGGSLRHARSGQRRRGRKIARSESGSLWSPQAWTCPPLLHEVRALVPVSVFLDDDSRWTAPWLQLEQQSLGCCTFDKKLTQLASRFYNLHCSSGSLFAFHQNQIVFDRYINFLEKCGLR